MKLHRQTLLLAMLHPLVDFCSVTILVTGGVTFGRWLAYNALAFALQGPLGPLLDAHPAWTRGAFALGCSLIAGGILTASFPIAGELPLVLVCTGNALFHLTAGKCVLDAHGGKSGPIGFFISTGALGLMAGELLSSTALLAPLAVLLLTGGFFFPFKGELRPPEASPAPRSASPQKLSLLILLLLGLVTWRSWAALLVGSRTPSTALSLLLAGAAVTWAGKVTGGFLADALQRHGFNGRLSAQWAVTSVSVIGSLCLCLTCSPSQTWLYLALLFLAQLATGPVLTLMYDACRRKAGSAFGLNCLALFTGSLL